MTYFSRLRETIDRNDSRLCVGLDPDPARIDGPVVPYLREVIAATSDLVCCYKPNVAFFEALGVDGMAALRDVLAAVPADVPVLGDAKRGDVGNTADAYARALFEELGFDAVTVNPYGGLDSVEPFFSYWDRGVYVWCRSSNPGAADFQDLLVHDGSPGGRPLYEVVAERVRGWNTRGNAALVAGATYPDQIRRLRRLCPELPLLLPGVGAQGADLTEAVDAASDGEGDFIVNASRGVLYADPGAGFAEAARREAERLRAAINAAGGAVVTG